MTTEEKEHIAKRVSSALARGLESRVFGIADAARMAEMCLGLIDQTESKTEFYAALKQNTSDNLPESFIDGILQAQEN